MIEKSAASEEKEKLIEYFKKRGVIFKEKSSWQKNNCYIFYCKNKSTMEAVFGTNHIRCCSEAGCMKIAARIAEHSN
jgi:hypothetical protein